RLRHFQEWSLSLVAATGRAMYTNSSIEILYLT
ncbi:MAG: hypothetical protein H6Q05_3593, partial [Acidobacteria bacterium]|nr:hypothetical protein [Acidobacteriota bacterium]